MKTYTCTFIFREASPNHCSVYPLSRYRVNPFDHLNQQLSYGYFNWNTVSPDSRTPADNKSAAAAMLTHLPLDKMAVISQAMYSRAFYDEKSCILMRISLMFVPNGPIDNNPALV